MSGKCLALKQVELVSEVLSQFCFINKLKKVAFANLYNSAERYIYSVNNLDITNIDLPDKQIEKFFNLFQSIVNIICLRNFDKPTF